MTLDERPQTAAEAALADQTKHPTALVVVKASTGEVLAAAVGPGADGAPLALAGKEAPGSTFKIASTLALVRQGATAGTTLPCTDTLTVNGRFGNYSKYPASQLGDISLERALAYSCNTAFISQHGKVSQDDLPGQSRWGWARTSTCRSPASSGPCRPRMTPSSTPRRSSARPGRGLAADHGARRRIGDEGRDRPAPAPRLRGAAPGAATPLQPEAEVLRQTLRAVVTEGSGRALQPVGVEYAKTGTAEFGTANPPKTHAWMVAGVGDLAIAAYNEGARADRRMLRRSSSTSSAYAPE